MSTNQNRNIMIWHSTLFLLSCVIWMNAWHLMDPPPQHDFFLCTTPVKFSKPCPVMSTWMSILGYSKQLTVGKISKTKPLVLAHVAILLLGASCDVELNPGPDSSNTQDSIYPCGICQMPVTWEQNSICCDTCQLWNHKVCLSMSTTMFTHLANSDTSWICPSCENPNFSSILFNTPVTTSSDGRYSMITDSLRSSTNTGISTPNSFDMNFSDVFNSPSSDSSPGIPQAASSPQVHPASKKSRTAMKDNLKIAVLNCNSIMNKVAEFQTFLADTDPDIILGTESWLKPEVSSSEVFPQEYSVFRKDRQADIKKSGGGVFILTRKEYICSELTIKTQCEFVAIEMQLIDQQNIKICNFYRPPWTDESYLDDFTEAIRQVDVKAKGNIWVGGDFNLPSIDWSDDKPLPGNVNVNKSKLLLDCMHDFAMTQVVDLPTRNQNTLDLFFTTNPTLVNRVITIPPLTLQADHDIVFIDLNTRASMPKKSCKSRYLFDKADWDGMRNKMSSYRLPTSSVQGEWDDIEATLISLMDTFVPSRPPKSVKQKPWMTREVITLIHRRNRAFKAWRRVPTPENHQKYLSLRKLSQLKHRQCYRSYTESIFNPEDEVNSRNKFWNFVKHKRKDSCNIAPMRRGGVLISDSLGKASIINNQYSSVFTPISDDTPDKPALDIPPLQNITISPEGVKKLLLSLKPTKAAGPDHISPRVLKELAEELYLPLSKFFQHSLDSGTVPKQWKRALVTPIFKKGDKHNPANYRPVSLTAVCCKILEHIVSKSILTHLESNHILTDDQHGFRHRRSCETQLILFVDELLQGMCEGKQMDAVVMDFSKAFDMVPHKSLLVKLRSYGILNTTLCWIESFLSDRTQCVVVDGEISEPAPVTSGVPQGSVLGPILFLAFINDMPECISSQCRLFADDTIVYREIATIDDTLLLQQDLDALQRWEKMWGMSFNPTKCNIINITRKKKPIIETYTLKKEPLENVNVASYLGVQITGDLTWHNQVAKVVSKGNRALGFVRRNVKTPSKMTKTLAYQTLVRPTVEYASCIWSPHQKHLSHSIEMVQRRAVRYVCRNYERTASVTGMQSALKWDTLEQRRNKAIATMGYKIVNSLIAIPSSQLIPVTKTTRGSSSKFRQISTRTNYYKYSFFPTLVVLWNALPPDLISVNSLESFKEGLSKLHLNPTRQ